MVAGLAFLSKKSFNPSNLTNQKSVWEAEQESEKEKHRLRERKKQLRVERDHEELARMRDGSKGGDMATLRFMYDAPPGLDKKKKEEEEDGTGTGTGTGDDNCETGHPGIGFENCDGDDDAAAAFRSLFHTNPSTSTSTSSSTNVQSSTYASSDHHTESSALTLSGSTAEASQTKINLTQLEKAVGKRNQNASLTYDEQIARFPQLKHAPMAVKRDDNNNEGNNDVSVAFKPLGAQIRNVRCLKCGIWGHSRGDRECKLSGWDPFATSTFTSSSSAVAAKGVNGVSCSIMPPPTKRSSDGDDYSNDNQRRYDRPHEGKRSREEWDSEDSIERQRQYEKRRKRKHDKKSTEKERKRHKKEKKHSHRRRRHRDYDDGNDDDRSNRSIDSYSSGGQSSYDSSEEKRYKRERKERKEYRKDRKERKRHRRRREDRKKSRRRSPSYDDDSKSRSRSR